jgi:type VI secretion system secreted protein Hcp
MAAPVIHLEIPEIEGESGVAGYDSPPQIDCYSWSWGATQSASMHTASGGSTGGSHIMDLAITKAMDKASPNLMQYCAQGTHMPEVTLHVEKSAGKARMEWYKITMSNCIISSVSCSGSEGDAGTESVTINFQKYGIIHTAQGDEGEEDTETEVNFDIRASEET